MATKDTLKERERIKELINRKIESVIEWREEKIKTPKRRNTYIFEKLQEQIIFLIDNPDYERKETLIT